MDDRLAAEVERALSRDRPIRREHDCLTILENFETSFLSRAIEHETESHPIDQENEHSGENVELAAVEVEPEEESSANSSEFWVRMHGRQTTSNATPPFPNAAAALAAVATMPGNSINNLAQVSQ